MNTFQQPSPSPKPLQLTNLRQGDGDLARCWLIQQLISSLRQVQIWTRVFLLFQVVQFLLEWTDIGRGNFLLNCKLTYYLGGTEENYDLHG
jgi:hypothetical protein